MSSRTLLFKVTDDGQPYDLSRDANTEVTLIAIYRFAASKREQNLIELHVKMGNHTAENTRLQTVTKKYFGLDI